MAYLTIFCRKFEREGVKPVGSNSQLLPKISFGGSSYSLSDNLKARDASAKNCLKSNKLLSRRLKQLQPDLLVSQPTYGYPQVFRFHLF